MSVLVKCATQTVLGNYCQGVAILIKRFHHLYCNVYFSFPFPLQHAVHLKLRALAGCCVERIPSMKRNEVGTHHPAGVVLRGVLHFNHLGARLLLGWVKAGTNPSPRVRQGRMDPAGTGLLFGAGQGRIMLGVGCGPLDGDSITGVSG